MGHALTHVLFVCTGNTCRSVLAEYLARKMFGDDVTFESAGIEPQIAANAENAVHTLRQNFAIDASAHMPRDVRTLDLGGFDLIIAFGNDVATVVKELGAPDSKVNVWKVPDPWGPDLTEYDRASLEIKKKLAHLRGSRHDSVSGRGHR